MKIPSTRAVLLALLAANVAGCAMMSPEETVGPARKEFVFAVTDSHQLVRFNAGQPQKILSKVALSGLDGGDELVGIDYRVARGVLFALSRGGKLYTVNTASGALAQVGSGKFALALDGTEFGFDFNPTVDRIRIVSTNGQNLRAHPDTGALVDADPDQPGVQGDRKLAYANGDRNAGLPPNIMAAAYTYNKENAKITTNFAIDGRLDALVTMGTREGMTPGVSPNTGQMFTVGNLGLSQAARVAFDISDVNNAAYAAFTSGGGKASRLHAIDLTSAKATFIGTIGGGEAIRGMAIEP